LQLTSPIYAVLHSLWGAGGLMTKNEVRVCE
jgi:hypothetical protein